jgi:uncharacterized membrane protein YhaH (DUF805 family)
LNTIGLLFSFRGRINRARYLVVQLALLTFWLTWLKYQFHFPSQWEAFNLVVAIAMIWINAATTVKRLHDHDRSGWWAVAILLVNRLFYLYYGLFLGNYFGVDISTAEQLLLVLFAVALSLLLTWIFIELVFMIGTDGPNRFGPDPTRPALKAPSAPRTEPFGVPDFLLHRAGPRPTQSAG